MSIYELIDWTYPPPGEGPRPYFGYSLDRDTNKYVAHRPPATPMTSIVKLERDDTVDLGDDPQWKETLRAISMLEGWLFTTWGTDIEQATLVVLIVGWKERPPDTFSTQGMLAHDVFASFRHRLTVKPEIHSLFLPSIQNTSSFQHGLREIIILRGNSSNFSEKVLQGSWEYIGMTRPLTACHDGWEDVPNLTQGWVLIPGSDKTRVMIEIWNWNDLEHMRRIKDPMQPNRGPHDSYSSQITYLLDEALAGGVRAQVLKTQLCRAMTVASVQREESKRLKKRCCIVQ